VPGRQAGSSRHKTIGVLKFIITILLGRVFIPGMGKGGRKEGFLP
jgi:hypothetical protein